MKKIILAGGSGFLGRALAAHFVKQHYEVVILTRAPHSVFPVLRRLVRVGLGGRQGTGNQFVSWIHQDDFCRAVEWLIPEGKGEGVFNVCAPQPLRNFEMMDICAASSMGRSVFRPLDGCWS